MPPRPRFLASYRYFSSITSTIYYIHGVWQERHPIPAREQPFHRAATNRSNIAKRAEKNGAGFRYEPV